MASYRAGHNVERRGFGASRHPRGQGPNGQRHGRLTRIPGELTNVGIKVTFTASEAEALRAVAKELDLTIVAVVREAVNAMVSDYREGEPVLNRHGARRVPTTEKARKQMLKELHAHVLELMRLENEVPA